MQAADDTPLVVLNYGLTGRKISMNMVRDAIHDHWLGCPVLRLNNREARPSRAFCKGDKHAGCGRVLADALLSVIVADPELSRNGLYIFAVSFGANIIIKFLAE